MDGHIGITTDETLRPTLLFGIFGTKHLSEQRFQQGSLRIAPRQASNAYKSHGLPKGLAKRASVESIIP